MISVFDLFKIGLGPSSSHTVGPMKAAKAFSDALEGEALAPRVTRLKATLYGSLAWTGRGHATDKAVMLGLAGHAPDAIDPDVAERVYARALRDERLAFFEREVDFDAEHDIVFDTLGATPFHPNTLAFQAFDEAGAELMEQRWCSVGGGFILREGETQVIEAGAAPAPYPFANAAELLAVGAKSGLTIAEMTRANEVARRPASEVQAYLVRVREAMKPAVPNPIHSPTSSTVTNQTGGAASLERALAPPGDPAMPAAISASRKAAACPRMNPTTQMSSHLPPSWREVGPSSSRGSVPIDTLGVDGADMDPQTSCPRW